MEPVGDVETCGTHSCSTVDGAPCGLGSCVVSVSWNVLVMGLSSELCGDATFCHPTAIYHGCECAVDGCFGGG